MEPEENATPSASTESNLPASLGDNSPRERRYHPDAPSGVRSSGGTGSDEALPSSTPAGARSSGGDEALPPQTISPEMIAAAPLPPSIPAGARSSGGDEALPPNGDTPEAEPFVESTAPWARGISSGLEDGKFEVLMQERMNEMMKALEKLEPHEPPPTMDETPPQADQNQDFDI